MPGHRCIQLFISLFMNIVSNCKIKDRKMQAFPRDRYSVTRQRAKRTLVGFRLETQMNPNGFHFTELCIIYFVTEIRVSGNWKSMNWFKYYAKMGLLLWAHFYDLKITFQHFPDVRGYDRAALINTFRPNHQEKDLELQISLVKDAFLGSH